MSYQIEVVDLKDPEVDEQMRNLMKDAFGTDQLIPPGHLYKNTFAPGSSKETVFLAAVEDNRIIGCNGFMATDFVRNGQTVSCYQSCWSATHPKHQGRKIFINILNEGKRLLKEREAGFIYGVPNNNSHPIFINKLGFKEIPSVMVQIPNIPFIKNFYFDTPANNSIQNFKKNSFCIVEKQIAGLKKGMGDDDIIEISKNNSYLWGKRKEKKTRFGITLNYFYVGGIELENATDMELILQEIFSNHRVHYLQIVSCQNNLYNSLLKKWKSTVMNGFIFFELNTEPIENVNLFYGAIDVF